MRHHTARAGVLYSSCRSFVQRTDGWRALQVGGGCRAAEKCVPVAAFDSCSSTRNISLITTTAFLPTAAALLYLLSLAHSSLASLDSNSADAPLRKLVLEMERQGCPLSRAFFSCGHCKEKTTGYYNMNEGVLALCLDSAKHSSIFVGCAV